MDDNSLRSNFGKETLRPRPSWDLDSPLLAETGSEVMEQNAQKVNLGPLFIASNGKGSTNGTAGTKRNEPQAWNQEATAKAS